MAVIKNIWKEPKKIKKKDYSSNENLILIKILLEKEIKRMKVVNF